MTRRRLTAAAAVVLIAVLLCAATVAVRRTLLKPTTIVAYFTSATGIYPGDQVRVSGVEVGTVGEIDPRPGRVRMTLRVEHGVSIPAAARAVIVAQNLVAARYVQLTPAYRYSGPRMPDGAEIPVERTAIPVEWDEVKEQLTRLATELGPSGDTSSTSVSRFIDSAAVAMDGNGDKLREMLRQLSAVARVLADGSGNVADVIANLALFVSTLRASTTQIVQFENRLATLTSVLDDSRSDLDDALTELSKAVVEVQRFVAGTRDQTSEQIRRLANVTQNLVDNRLSLENVLHVAPTATANFYNVTNPDSGTTIGSFAFTNMSNPVAALCGAIGAVENVTAVESGKLCSEYLGPALRLLNFNYLPFPINPLLTASPTPGNLIYSEERLKPGGLGPKPGPPEQPPAVSAYTGLPGDTVPIAPPPPPARIPGIANPAPTTPVTPNPELAPAPPPLPEVLLPAEVPAP